MLRHTHQPQLVGDGCSEVSLDKVVIDPWVGLGVLAPLGLLTAPTEPAVGGADPPRSPLRHHLACGDGLIGQEPVAELRIIAVRVKLSRVKKVAGFRARESWVSRGRLCRGGPLGGLFQERASCGLMELYSAR